MTEQKLAEWIADNQVGIDEYGMPYNDTLDITLPMAGSNMPVERLSCDSLKRVFIRFRNGQAIYSAEYAQLTEYLQEKISDAVEAASKKE